MLRILGGGRSELPKRVGLAAPLAEPLSSAGGLAVSPRSFEVYVRNAYRPESPAEGGNRS